MTGTKGSRKAAVAALRLAMTESRDEEYQLRKTLGEEGIRSAAVDYGGEYVGAVKKIIERAVVAAKREQVIRDTHHEEGAIAGATHEAMMQIMAKAIGLNIGGKVGIARYRDHVSVAIFFGIGLLHLDEVAVGMGHRAALEEGKLS
ncbi:hut operon positive regulator HutP [Heliorestis acidaminivorans]|uniref:Hut operon positive regulatory protein n=1 Tax=Heliorestis acidaminivorans TaxID=553427 RepID=A0A6I0F004_9FIRM|nr:HutP family protein [Heliorestis acidaminivorans]KAB2952631.1 hut operon positive regulator HutP [Heliorestis acidaminivorans]